MGELQDLARDSKLGRIDEKQSGSQQDDTEKYNVTNQVMSGMIDYDASSRPARPDPVDFDETEVQMLNDAVARLANTKGKKALRKAERRRSKEENDKHLFKNELN